MKQIVMCLLNGILLLTACAPSGKATPVITIQNTKENLSPIPTSTSTSIPTETLTVTITPLPTIPTFTPTFDELIQPNPFPTSTPNPTAQALSAKWNSKNVFLSPDGQWAAVVDSEILRIIQIQGARN